MICYIYFVKCQGCEDEHFDFFDEAKAYAMQNLSAKPVITQTEVDRNDFGECTDHCELGTVWSWEDAVGRETDVTDAEPAKAVFTRDDLKDYIPDEDPEFQDDDFFAINAEEPAHAFEDSKAEDERKPVPEGMTIEQLVETMEENEDMVECAGCEELFPKDECFHKEGIGWLCGDCEDTVVKCTWCEELFGKDQCRYEVDLGWLCSRCEMAIKSRGETLTFREGNYWDFLDEKLDIDLSNIVDSSDMEIYGIEPAGENVYKTVLMKRYENVDFKDMDAPQAVHDEMLELGGLFLFYFDKAGAPALDSWNPELLRRLGKCDIYFDDDRYEQATARVFNKVSSAGNTELSKLEELEEAADYRKRLTMCPECGVKEAFDHETGFCIKCGFNA